MSGFCACVQVLCVCMCVCARVQSSVGLANVIKMYWRHLATLDFGNACPVFVHPPWSSSDFLPVVAVSQMKTTRLRL